MEPTAQPLELPADYGRATRTLAWAGVRAALEQAKQYWLATTRPDGRPHVTPLDGLWIDDVWYYGGAPTTVHRRNVAANPHAALHLPDPWRVVIVEGEVRTLRPAADFAARLAEASFAKYPEYGPTGPEGYAEVLGLHPVRARAWTEFPHDMTRFTFPPAGPPGAVTAP